MILRRGQGVLIVESGLYGKIGTAYKSTKCTIGISYQQVKVAFCYTICYNRVSTLSSGECGGIKTAGLTSRHADTFNRSSSLVG